MDRIAAAAMALKAAPADLGAWLGLARAVELGGQRRRAETAYASLGAAANQLGSVALAAACARWLARAGSQARARALVTAIADRQCRGSDRIDRTLRTPPVPPPESSPAIELGAAAQQGLTEVDEAIAAAAASASERAPAKLPMTPLVGALERDDLFELVSMTELSWREPGDVIVDVGQPAHSLYWIARGTLSVTRGEHALGELRSNSFFGEIALLAGTTRTARVTCADACWLIEIPAASVEDVASRAPRLAKLLANYARARLLSNVMRTSELFSRLDEDERRELLPRFQTRIFQAGQTIVAQGSDSPGLLVVASGECELRDGGATLARLSVGDGIGEMSLLARKPAASDVVATQMTVVLALDRAEFDDIAVKHPGLLAEVYKLLVTRERESREPIVHDASDLII